MKYISSLVILIWWLSGIVFAKGFCSTTAAVIFPPYGMYLVVEKAIELKGWK